MLQKNVVMLKLLVKGEMPMHATNKLKCEYEYTPIPAPLPPISTQYTMYLYLSIKTLHIWNKEIMQQLCGWMPLTVVWWKQEKKTSLHELNSKGNDDNRHSKLSLDSCAMICGGFGNSNGRHRRILDIVTLLYLIIIIILS